MELDFCRGWNFHKQGEPSTIVDPPHDAMLLEPRTKHGFGLKLITIRVE